YVRGTAELDYVSPLQAFGLNLERERRVTNYEYGVRFKQQSGRLVVDMIEYDGLAARGGLRKGDIVLKIGSAAATPSVARDVFGKGTLEPLTVTVLRDGSENDLTIPEIPSRVVCRVVPAAVSTPEQDRL